MYFDSLWFYKMTNPSKTKKIKWAMVVEIKFCEENSRNNTPPFWHNVLAVTTQFFQYGQKHALT